MASDCESSRTIRIVCPDLTFPLTFPENRILHKNNVEVILGHLKDNELHFSVHSRIVMPFIIYNFYSYCSRMPDKYVYDTSALALSSVDTLNAQDKLIYLELYRSFGIKIHPSDLIFSELSREMKDINLVEVLDLRNTSVDNCSLVIGLCFLDVDNFVKLYKKFFSYEYDIIWVPDSDSDRCLKLKYKFKYPEPLTYNPFYTKDINIARDLVIALLTRLDLSIDKDDKDIIILQNLRDDAFRAGTQIKREFGHFGDITMVSLIELIFFAGNPIDKVKQDPMCGIFRDGPYGGYYYDFTEKLNRAKTWVSNAMHNSPYFIL